MPFEKGKSGNPKGAGLRAKPWRDALQRAVYRRVGKGKDDPKALEKIADAVVDAALAGEMEAVKEIANRLDGKPVQPIAGDDEMPIKTILEVKWKGLSE